MSAPWTERPFLAIDTETTGTDVYADRIVEIASVTVMPDGSLVEPWSTVIDPGVDVPEGAAAIHGITTERARADGVEPAKALAEIAERIFAHQGGYVDGAPVVMFNATFDWPLLLAEAERHSVEFPVFAPILDPLLIDRMVDKYRKGSRQLTVVATNYGVTLDAAEAHGALADATAAGRVMRRLLDRYPTIGEHTLAGVYLRQVKGYEAWREGFVDHRRRTKDPGFDKAPGWPVPAGAS